MLARKSSQNEHDHTVDGNEAVMRHQILDDVNTYGLLSVTDSRTGHDPHIAIFDRRATLTTGCDVTRGVVES